MRVGNYEKELDCNDDRRSRESNEAPPNQWHIFQLSPNLQTLNLKKKERSIIILYLRRRKELIN